MKEGNHQESGWPKEFKYAVEFVSQLKSRFADKPEIYREFLEICIACYEKQRSIKQVFEEVSLLFEGHPDLLRGFTFFLPDGLQSEAMKELPADLLQKFASSSLDDNQL